MVGLNTHSTAQHVTAQHSEGMKGKTARWQESMWAARCMACWRSVVQASCASVCLLLLLPLQSGSAQALLDACWLNK